MMEAVRMYWKLVTLQTKSQLEYRGAFVLMYLAKILGWGSDFIVILIMFSSFQSVSGWDVYDLLFIHALNILSHSLIAQFLLNPCNNLSEQVQNGAFDGILIKPVNPFFYYIFRIFSTGYISNISMCLVVLGIVLSKIQFEFSFHNMLFL